MDGTALVLCEGQFDSPDGKTAHGLVRGTDRYEIAMETMEDMNNVNYGQAIILTLCDSLPYAFL